MSDWKQRAIDAYERHGEEAELQEAERKICRIEQAKEKLIAALQELKIPLPADVEVLVEDHEDDLEIGAIPFVIIDEVEFTHSQRGPGHGGGLGIVTMCPRCEVRWRGPYIYDEVILGRELRDPSRIDHFCQTEEEKAEQAAIDARVDGHTATMLRWPGAEERYVLALRDMMREVADEQIQLRTGA